MFLGREVELNKLEALFKCSGNNIAMVYGPRQIGKSALIQTFLNEKSSITYHAKSCSEREQKFQWAKQLNVKELVEYPNYEDILQVVFDSFPVGKSVFVIEDVEYLLKENISFFQILIQMLPLINKEIMVIFTTSSVRFARQHCGAKLGELWKQISEVIEIKELNFQHLVKYFPNFTRQESMEAYAILGGYPGLWKQLNPNINLANNIIKNILDPFSYLGNYPKQFIEQELRETNVYFSILSVLARGHFKLNDLYQYTGYSRAKISVYLKNLMELGIVKKSYSVGPIKNSNTKKGIYEFANHFIHFYFAMIFPNEFKLEPKQGVQFYKDEILPNIDSFVQGYFTLICEQYLNQLNRHNRLPIKYTKVGTWVGKIGTIDLVLEDENSNMIVAFGNYNKAIVTYEDYEKYVEYLKNSMLPATHIFIFTMHKFDDKLTMKSKENKNLTLVSIKGK